MTYAAHPTHSDSARREVVVGLVNDGMALAVALRGVELAAGLGASVRFVQVVPPDIGPGDRAEAESATFAAGLRALRHGKHRGATFESPGGDPATVLVARSAKALGLVVGGAADRADVAPGTVDVAAYCSAHARCPVHVVRREPTPAGRDQSHWEAADSAPSVVGEPPVATQR